MMVKSIDGHKSNPPHHPGPPKPVHQPLISESSPFGFKHAAQPPLSSSCDLCKPLELHASGKVNNKAPHHYQQQDDNKEGDNGSIDENEGDGGDRDHGRVDGSNEDMDGPHIKV